MRTSITIIKDTKGDYIATARGKDGRGFTDANAGTKVSHVAGRAARWMSYYATSNSEGGDLIAPAEVLALVPKQLRSIPARKKLFFADMPIPKIGALD